MIGAIHSQWVVDNRVRFISAVGQIDLEMAKAQDAEALRIYDAAPQPIHMIIDVRYTKAVPAISECLKLASLWHKNLDMVVTVGAMSQPSLRLLFTALVRLARLKYQDVATLDEAQQFLITCDPSLPSLETWRLGASRACSGQ
jgi:hypothetical protein